MQHVGRIHARVAKDTTIEDRHLRLSETLNSLGGPWQTRSPIPRDVTTGAKYDIALVKSFNAHLPRGLSIQAVYQRRRADLWERDDFTLDDGLNIRLSGKVDFRYFVTEVYEKIIKSFGAYYAYISTEKYDDERVPLAEIGAQRDNLRGGASKICLINYFDEIMCTRTFGVGPSRIGDILSRRGRLVAVDRNGVYFGSGEGSLSSEQERQICIEMRNQIMDELG
jgi:hypothetical protein